MMLIEEREAQPINQSLAATTAPLMLLKTKVVLQKPT